ncbi:MAG: TonB family protein [Terriglobales bacterium]
MTAACEGTGIRADVCSDIFTAIEKAKTKAFSCVVADWADQPEASFLLKRARESTSNRTTIALAVVDHEPTAAEMRDNQLDFLIYRPISEGEANDVLLKACERMQPASVADLAELPRQASVTGDAGPALGGEVSEQNRPGPPMGREADEVDGNEENAVEQDPRGLRPPRVSLRQACAAVLVLTAMFFMWKSREALVYLSRTPEGGFRVLRDSAAALFYMNQTGALPVSSAGTDVQQDAYFSRKPTPPEASATPIGVVATESTAETRVSLPKAADLPLPEAVLVHQEVPPVHVERAAIPESMRNSPPIAPPVVVAVNPAQMMAVSAPVAQPIPQPISEPVALSEDAARALLVHSVEPVYPAEGMGQKLHGAVVLQAVIGRDGTVEDLKIVRGYFILGRAAIAAVKQWRFQPYTLGGHPAATETTITVNFSAPTG